MKAIEVEKKINSNLDNIINVMVSFFGKPYKHIIENSFNNSRIMVYDNLYRQKERLKLVEFQHIAGEFAKDIVSEFDFNEKTKNLLEMIIAKIIVNASNNEKQARKIIEDEIKKTPVLNSNVSKYTDKIMELVQYYNNDFERKKYLEIINDTKTARDRWVQATNTYICEWVENRFKYKAKDIIDANEVIYTLMGFAYIETDETFDLNKKEFYKLIGCKGNSLEELEKDAIKKKVDINEQKFLNLYGEFSQHIDYLTKKYLREYDNFTYIFEETGLTISGLDEHLQTLEEDFSGFKFSYETTDYFIINNTHHLYSKEGTKMILKELLSYPVFRKETFDFEQEDKYINFREAFLEYISTILVKDYLDKHDNILPDLLAIDSSNKKSELAYMENVVSEYKDELIKIYLDKDIEEEEIFSICPFNKIVDDFTKFKNEDNKKNNRK